MTRGLLGVPWPRSARGRHPLAALPGVDQLAVVLAQAAPHAVRLANGERMPPAGLEHRAAGAHRAGGIVPAAGERNTPPPPQKKKTLVPAAASCTALALGMEEQLRVDLPAGPLELPFPDIGYRTGKPGDVSHVAHHPHR
jgi:hypothetical protein